MTGLTNGQLPRAPASAWIQWRARRIRDPYRRLKYLRRAMGASSGFRDWRGTTRRPVWAVAILVPLALAFVGGRHAFPTLVRADLRRIVAPSAAHPAGTPRGEVWLVERRGSVEVFSNGLRIETASEVQHEPRQASSLPSDGYVYVAGSTEPAGIVYHTTESHIAPFEPGENQRLQRVGKLLVDYLRERHSYHYLIDRFGRVHRIVPEQHAANHAGASVWADRNVVYLNLNHSFLGVSFESSTAPGDQVSDSVTPAQIDAGRTLTQWLLAKHSIAAHNCVTHAQVSVNPDNFRIGNHTDWAGNFPFAGMGLPDNYGSLVGALYAFGFTYDQDFVGSTGSRLWKGLAASEDHLRQMATAQGLPVAEFRERLRARYRDTVARLNLPGMAGRSVNAKEKSQ